MLTACFDYQSIFRIYVLTVEMFRVRSAQSAMGVRDVWHLDLFGVLGQTSGPGRSFVVRALGDDGQVEGYRAGKDESKTDDHDQCNLYIIVYLCIMQMCRRAHKGGRKSECP